MEFHYTIKTDPQISRKVLNRCFTDIFALYPKILPSHHKTHALHDSTSTAGLLTLIRHVDITWHQNGICVRLGASLFGPLSGREKKTRLFITRCT